MGNTNSSDENEASRERRRPQNQNSDGLDMLGAVLGSVAVAGAAYATYRFAQSDDSTANERANTTARYENYQTPAAEVRRSGNAVIAVDATPTCGGGLLVLPRENKVYHYSLNWSSQLRFGPTPDVFEMTNALIAMTLWESIAKIEESVIIKVDNTVFGRGKFKAGNTYWNNIESVRRDIGGTWISVTSGSDKEHKIADNLSRNKTVNWNQGYEGWKIVGVDELAESVLGDLIRSGNIPTEYFQVPNVNNPTSP